MKLFGIFDKNKNYELLRYSTYLQDNSTYEKYNKDIDRVEIVNEICLPDIEYSTEYIGKCYDPNNNNFIS